MERKDTLHKEKLISSEIEYHLTSKAAVQITVALLPGLWNLNADLVSLPYIDIEWCLLEANYFFSHL